MIIRSIVLGSLLFIGLAAPTNADIATFDLSIGVWDVSMDGDLGMDAQPVSLNELNTESSTAIYAKAYFEHAIPMLPHIHIAYLDTSASGTVLMFTREAQITDITIPVDADLTTNIDIRYIDYTLYWSPLDTIVHTDIGITGRAFDNSASVSYTLEADAENAADTGSEEKTMDDILPMLYGHLAVDLPFSGWFASAAAHYGSLSDNTASDIEFKIGFMSDDLGLDIGFDVGYRKMTLTFEDENALQADIVMDGVFANVVLHF